MKKLLAVALFVGVFSLSLQASWVIGKVEKIQNIPAGLYVTLKKADNSTVFAKITLTGDNRKEMMAVLLTAKASEGDISLFSQAGAWAYYAY